MSDCEKLKSIINEIDNLIGQNAVKSLPAFQAWHTDAERFLSKKYGGKSLELSKFQETRFTPSMWVDKSDVIAKCKNDLMATKLTFESYLAEMQEETECASEVQSNISYNKVFIVHGHDGELKASVARIIEKQGIEAVILSEQANQGRTIIEKFEEHSNVAGAVCLFTADDVGKANSADDMQPRARQNVVFEAGYFIGKLGRDHIVILADKGVEMPSDLSGVVHTDTGNWQFDLIKELKAMGYAVDANKLL